MTKLDREIKETKLNIERQKTTISQNNQRNNWKNYFPKKHLKYYNNKLYYLLNKKAEKENK